MGIGKTIKYLREQRGINKRQFALAIGIKPPRINQLEKTDGNMMPHNLRKAAEFFGMTIEDLLKMAYHEEAVKYPRTPEQVISELQEVQPIAIPIVAEGSAGEGDGFVNYAYWVKPKAAGRNIQGIEIKGNCLEPEIFEGDTVFVDTDDLNPKHRDFVACLVDGRLLIKRFLQLDSGIALEDKNGVVTGEDIKIQGVVIQRNVKLK